MLLLKVNRIENISDTEKIFSSMLSLDEPEKPPVSKVEMLHLEWKSSCPNLLLPLEVNDSLPTPGAHKCSLQHSVLQAMPPAASSHT